MSLNCHLCPFMGYTRDVTAFVDESRNFCYIDRCSSSFTNPQALWEHIHLKHRAVKCAHCGKIVLNLLPTSGDLNVVTSVNNLAKNIQNKKRKFNATAGPSTSSSSITAAFNTAVGSSTQPEAPKKLRRFHDLLLEGHKIWEFATYEQLKAYLSGRSDDSIIALLVRSELLVSKRSCNKCGNPMKLRSRLGSYVKNNPTVEWRCRNNTNGKKRDCSTQSCRNGSFFASSNSSLQNQVETLFQWKDNFITLDGSLVSFSSSPLVKQFSDVWIKFLDKSDRPNDQLSMFVDFVTFPAPQPANDEHIVLLTERKFNGRAAARIVHGDPRSYPQLTQFITESVAAGSILIFEDSQGYFASEFPGWRTTTASTLNSPQFQQTSGEMIQSCSSPCRYIITTLLNTPYRCPMSEIVQESIIKFNNREDLPKLFWKLLSVDGNVYFTKPRKIKHDNAPNSSQVSQSSSVLNTFLAFHGLKNNL